MNTPEMDMTNTVLKRSLDVEDVGMQNEITATDNTFHHSIIVNSDKESFDKEIMNSEDVIYPASINVTTAGTETKINSSETAAETIYTNMPENNDVCIERRIPSKKRKGVQNLFMERKGVLFATGVSVILLVFTGIVVYTFVQQSE